MNNIGTNIAIWESPHDDILRFASVKVVNAHGEVLDPSIPQPQVEFDNTQRAFLKKVLNDKIKVFPKNSGLPMIAVSPRDLLGRVQKDPYLRTKFKASPWVGGGVARVMLNPRVLKAIWGSRLPDGALDGVRHRHERLPDYDFAIYTEIGSEAELLTLQATVLKVLCSLYPKEAQITPEKVRKVACRLHKPSWNENKMLVTKVGDERSIELKLYDRMRKSLFTIDAWEVQLGTLLPGGEGEPKLRCRLPPEWFWQCAFDFAARLIRAVKPETINQYGWPRMMMHITNEHRCLQPELAKILWKNMAPYVPPCNLLEHLKRCLVAHFPNDKRFAWAFFVNASLHIEDSLSLRALWRSTDPAFLSPAIQSFLQHPGMDFSDVKLMFQVVALVGCLSGDTSVCCTQHLESTHFQVMLWRKELGVTLLIPVNTTAVQVLYERLSGLDWDAQKGFLHAFGAICREFHLLSSACPEVGKGGRRHKMGYLSSIAINEEVAVYLAALLPELCPIFSIGSLEAALEKMGLPNDLPKVPKGLFAEALIDWVERLMQREEPQYQRAAYLTWIRLVDIDEPRSLSSLSQNLAVRAAQVGGVEKGIEVVEYARQRGDWSAVREMEVETLFGILSPLVSENGRRFAKSDTVWLESEKLRKMIVAALLSGQFPANVFSERVKRGILWMAGKFARTDTPDQGLDLLKAATDNRWLGSDHEYYVRAKASLVRCYLAQGCKNPVLYIGDDATLPVVELARGRWSISEKRRLLNGLLASVREGMATTQILECVSSWLQADAALLATPYEAMQAWVIFLHRQDGAGSWGLWTEKVLSLYLQCGPSQELWTFAASLLENTLAKKSNEPLVLQASDAEKLMQFLQDGLQWDLLYGLQLTQRLETLKLCPKIHWQSFLQDKILPWDSLQGTESAQWQQIISYWINIEEVKLAESWLVSSDDLCSHASLYEDLLIKQLELGGGPSIVEKTLIAFRKGVFTVSQRQDMWARALKRFLKYSQEGHVVTSLELNRPFLTTDFAKIRYFRRRLSALLEIVSKPDVLHLELFLELMHLAPPAISSDVKFWKLFVFSALKMNQIEKGWEAFCKAPIDWPQEISRDQRWLNFFSALAVRRPQDLFKMVTNPRWETWFSQEHQASSCRQIIFYLEYGLHLFCRKHGGQEGMENLKRHLLKGQKLLSEADRDQEWVQAFQTMICTFMACDDAEGVTNGMELMKSSLVLVLRKEKRKGMVRKLCEQLLKCADTIHARTDSKDEECKIEQSALSLLGTCATYSLPMRSQGRLSTLFLASQSKSTTPFDAKLLKLEPGDHTENSQRAFMCSLILFTVCSLALLVNVVAKRPLSDQ